MREYSTVGRSLAFSDEGHPISPIGDVGGRWLRPSPNRPRVEQRDDGRLGRRAWSTGSADRPSWKGDQQP